MLQWWIPLVFTTSFFLNPKINLKLILVNIDGHKVIEC